MPLVKFYANLRTIAGRKEVSLTGLSVREVLGRLIQDYPGLQGFLLEDGHVRRRVIITINGQTLDSEAGLDTPVSEHDQIAIFPPVAGG